MNFKINQFLLKFRLPKYVLLFGLLVTALYFLKGGTPIKDLDHFVYKSLYFSNSDNVKINPDIMVIDIEWPGELDSQIEEFREQLANLIDNIGEEINSDAMPKAILLDYFFDMTTTDGLDVLRNAIVKLKENQPDLKIYSIFNTLDINKKSYEDVKSVMDSILYNDLRKPFLLEGGGHTHSLILEASGVIEFDSYLNYPRENGGFKPILLAPLKIKNDITETSDFKVTLKPPETFVLPIGNRSSLKKNTYQFIYNNKGNYGTECEDNSDDSPFLRITSDCFESLEGKINDKIIIIGSLEADKIEKLPDSGPNLLAWALNDQLEQKDNGLSFAKTPYKDFRIILGLALVISIIVAGFYSWLYRSKIKFQSKAVLLLVLSIFVGIISILLAGLLFFKTEILPVGLITFSMGGSAVLSWLFHRKFTELGLAKGDKKYDLFISYSGEQRDWVMANVYHPLENLQNNEGDPIFKIFIDRMEIEKGSNYVNIYKRGILNSEIFIPVMTEEYFESPYCKKEMIYADGLAETDDIIIYPLAFNLEEVDPLYKLKNITVIDDNLDSIMKSELKDLLEKLKEKKSKKSVEQDSTKDDNSGNSKKKETSKMTDTNDTVEIKETKEVKEKKEDKKSADLTGEKEREIKKQENTKNPKIEKKKKGEKLKKKDETSKDQSKSKNRKDKLKTKDNSKKTKKSKEKKKNNQSAKKTKKQSKKKDKKEQKKKKRKRSEKKATKRHHKTSKKGSKKKKSKQSKKKKK